jgi:uncharacterized protein YkwD
VGSIKKIGILLVMAIIVLLSAFSCSQGVTQEEYDSIMNELTEKADQLMTLEDELSEALKIGVQYKELEAELRELNEELEAELVELKEQNDANLDELESKEAQYDELSTEFEELKIQNESNKEEIATLEAQYEELKNQYDAITAPLPEVTEVDIEQTLLALINLERRNHGLDGLQWGHNLDDYAEANNQNMAISKQHEQPSSFWVPYNQTFIGAGYETADEIANAAMTIWKNDSLQYENNVLTDYAIYGVVRVYISGDIIYITYLASNFP